MKLLSYSTLLLSLISLSSACMEKQENTVILRPLDTIGNLISIDDDCKRHFSIPLSVAQLSATIINGIKDFGLNNQDHVFDTHADQETVARMINCLTLAEKIGPNILKKNKQKHASTFAEKNPDTKKIKVIERNNPNALLDYLKNDFELSDAEKSFIAKTNLATIIDEIKNDSSKLIKLSNCANFLELTGAGKYIQKNCIALLARNAITDTNFSTHAKILNRDVLKIIIQEIIKQQDMESQLIEPYFQALKCKEIAPVRYLSEQNTREWWKTKSYIQKLLYHDDNKNIYLSGVDETDSFTAIIIERGNESWTISLKDPLPQHKNITFTSKSSDGLLLVFSIAHNEKFFGTYVIHRDKVSRLSGIYPKFCFAGTKHNNMLYAVNKNNELYIVDAVADTAVLVKEWQSLYIKDPILFISSDKSGKTFILHTKKGLWMGYNNNSIITLEELDIDLVSESNDAIFSAGTINQEGALLHVRTWDLHEKARVDYVYNFTKRKLKQINGSMPGTTLHANGWLSKSLLGRVCYDNNNAYFMVNNIASGACWKRKERRHYIPIFWREERGVFIQNERYMSLKLHDDAIQKTIEFLRNASLEQILFLGQILRSGPVFSIVNQKEDNLFAQLPDAVKVVLAAKCTVIGWHTGVSKIKDLFS